ncbi:MAG: sigma-54 dependent transcriptional regulator [Desulfobacterales bacterium]|jgi:DNA-binding NtrC family response regulator
MERSILIVDDEPDMLQLLKRSLTPDLNCLIETAASAKAALSALEKERFDLVLADIKMPEMDGLQLLEQIKGRQPELTVVMMTAFGQIDTAVTAMKSGAYDFITKPFDHEALVVRLEKALERSSLLQENLRLQEECRADSAFQKIVGKSAAMKKLFETIQMVAKSDMTVLITGESGTGKELVARAVHNLSERRKNRFVAVNCPTVPENILESELFGYRKGAFTHAAQDRMGLFQEAHRGTIFLDEIGDISPTIQTKLLRVLQEKEIKPLGDTKSISVDVRIIGSTNQNLEEKIKTATFREDFYYRLNVLPIRVPPLREHRQDIPMIATHLLEKHCVAMNRPLKVISRDLMQHLLELPWEGNVRELENIIVQGIMFSKSEEITADDVDIESQTKQKSSRSLSGAALDKRDYKDAKEETLRQFNHQYIGRLLSGTDGNVTQAAKNCGLERQALQQIMRRYGIRADDFRK